jgi:hypothetical protein
LSESSKSKHRSVELRLLVVLGGISAVAIVGVLSILPYRLYERDIRHATVEAHRIASVLHVSLSEAIAEGEDTAQLLNRFQGIADLQIRLRRLEPSEAHPAQLDRRGTSTLDGTDLTYVAAPILDPEGRTWLAEMYFDLAAMKRESIRLIIDLVIAVALGSVAFAGVVYWLIHRGLVVPLRETTRELLAHDASCGSVSLPEFESREMIDLVDALEHACRPVERADSTKPH